MSPSPYLRLMRLDKPTGIWLLLWPCWWSLALASTGLPSLRLLALFAVGAIAMRSAGCIVNDIIDRKIDAKVERTCTRPLASGELSLEQALKLLALLLGVAFVVLLHLPWMVVKLAVFSLLLVVGYPLMKRVTWWPQAFLGVTFNWGALMGWAAVTGSVQLPALFLYGAGIFWTLGYDTIYAHQDTKDDRLAGVKSTALRFGSQSKQWISGFYGVSVLGFLAAGAFAHAGWVYYAGVAGLAAHFSWQLRYVMLGNPVSCLRVFRSNIMVGWIVYAGIVGAKLIA